MKILLLNDNPVVRKLVALSAQKTKDDLSVVWSVDEIEDSAYDLLIVDDAHYSDEVMGALKEKISYKTALLMATRGNATPAGFDKIINKPFLPTDLVELFATIEKELAPAVKNESVQESEPEARSTDFDSPFADEEEGFDITNLNSDLELEELGLSDEGNVTTNVLDHEEVQELQDLLDDTDEIDDELSLEGLDLDDIDLAEEDGDELASFETPITLNDDLDDLDEEVASADSYELPIELEDELIDEEDADGVDTGSLKAESESEAAMEDFDLDDDLFNAGSETSEESSDEDEVIVESPILLDDDLVSEKEGEEDHLADIGELSLDEFDDESFSASGEEAALLADDEDIFDALDEDFSAIAQSGEDEEALIQDDMEMPLNDDELDELEQQIQEAVDELDISDMDQELDASDLDELGIGDMDALEGLDALDTLDEREIKMAIGEAVEEEPEIRIGQGSHASLDSEALDEAMGKLPAMDLEDELESMSVEEVPAAVCDEEKATPAEGMEALQALLKALSNDEVAKSLKGLNINININFGNEK